VQADERMHRARRLVTSWVVWKPLRSSPAELRLESWMQVLPSIARFSSSGSVS
jgi:hypothetical protein